MQRAFKLHLQFSEFKARSAALESTFDALPVGIILLGSNGEVVHMNRSAIALVSERDGLLATRNGLRAERPSRVFNVGENDSASGLDVTAKAFRLAER